MVETSIVCQHSQTLTYVLHRARVVETSIVCQHSQTPSTPTLWPT